MTTQAQEQTQEQEIEKKPEASPEEGVFVVEEGSADQETIEQMAKAGVLYGHKTFRRNPRFSDYVYGVRNGVELIDLTKTLKAIEVVSEYLKKVREEKKNIVIVATQAAAKDAVQKLSGALDGCPLVTHKWVGGLISNFPILSKRIEYYKKRKKDFEEKRFDKYTKKERLMIEREIGKMEQKFKGLEDFVKIPDVMIVFDSSLRGHKTAIAEAKLKKSTLVGVIDNDDNPEEFDYFIPANDHSKASIEWVVDRIIGNLS